MPFLAETPVEYLYSPITWLFLSCIITALAILTLIPFILFNDDIQQHDDYVWTKKKRRDLLLSEPILLRDTKESVDDHETEDTRDITTSEKSGYERLSNDSVETVVSAPMLQSLFHRLVVQDKWKEAGYVADHVYKLVRAKLLLTNLGVDGLRLLEDVIRGYPPGVENHVTAVFHTLADVVIGKYPGSAEEQEPASARDVLGRWSIQVMTSLITHVSTVARSDIVRMLSKRYFHDHVVSLQIWTFKSLSVFLLHCLKTRHELRTPENESIQLLLREGMTSRNKLVVRAAQDCLTHYTLVDSEAGDKLRYQIGANLG